MQIRRANADKPVPMQIKRVQTDERIRKLASKRSKEFNATHKLQTFTVGKLVLLKAHNVGFTEDNTETKFFCLDNGPYTLRERVGKNTYIIADKQINKGINKFHASSLQKYYQH